MKLVTELLWFRRFISENDLETEVEVEGDELVVYQDGKKFFGCKPLTAKRIRTKVLTSAAQARWYAEDILKSRFELGEPVIATDAYQSNLYAEFVLKGRFELGEPVIATDAAQSRWYARDVLKSRFELGEKVIATSAFELLMYKKFLATLK